VYDITDCVSFSAVSTWYNKAISVQYENVPTFALFSNKCKYNFLKYRSEDIKHIHYIVDSLKHKKWMAEK